MAMYDPLHPFANGFDDFMVHWEEEIQRHIVEGVAHSAG